LKRLPRLFYWPRLTKDVHAYIKSCVECHKSKASNHTHLGETQKRDVPVRPFQTLSVDGLGPLPTCSDSKAVHVWVGVCDLTRFLIAASTRQVTAESLVNFLIQHVFYVHGIPETIYLDNAPSNRSNLLKDLFAFFRIKATFGTPHKHATTAQVERAIGSIGTVIRSFVHDSPTNWSKYLNSAVFALNSTIHRSNDTVSFLLSLWKIPGVADKNRN
jgi:hypothetical protein